MIIWWHDTMRIRTNGGLKMQVLIIWWFEDLKICVCTLTGYYLIILSDAIFSWALVRCKTSATWTFMPMVVLPRWLAILSMFTLITLIDIAILVITLICIAILVIVLIEIIICVIFFMFIQICCCWTQGAVITLSWYYIFQSIIKPWKLKEIKLNKIKLNFTSSQGGSCAGKPFLAKGHLQRPKNLKLSPEAQKTKTFRKAAFYAKFVFRTKCTSSSSSKTSSPSSSW